MGDFFLDLLNLSIAASWVVLAVAALRLLLKKIPKWIVCLMWATVGLRLAVPFSIKSRFSLIPSIEMISGSMHNGQVVLQSGIEGIDATVNGFLDTYYHEGSTVPTNFFAEIMQVCGIVWLIGVIVLSLYSLISFLRLHRRVQVSLQWKDRVYFCDDIETPFVLGIFRPRIYLPSGMDEKQISCVLRHEEAHIQRGDPLWKALGFVLLTVYWFNPVMWLAYMLFSRDIEQACDEKAIYNLNYGGKQEYSRALLFCGTKRKVFVACPVSFGEVGVKQRVRSVLSYERPGSSETVAALLFCALLSIGFLSSPTNNTAEYISQNLNSHTACTHVESYKCFHVQDGAIVGRGECVNSEWQSFHIHESGSMVMVCKCFDCGEIIYQDLLYDANRCCTDDGGIVPVR